MSKLTGFITSGGEKAYFFTEKDYVRYDVAADAVDEGYPKPIAGNWDGVFEADIDAVLAWPDGSVYFFRGDEYVRFNSQDGSVDSDYPKPIAGNWPGVFGSDIDAAVLWTGGEVAYFFSGDQYVRFDVAANAAGGDYPKTIADHWPGLFDSGIEAAVLWPSGSAHFFRGDEYIKYDPAADSAVEGYPRPIAGDWRGLPISPLGGGPGPAQDGDALTPLEDPGGGRITDKSEPSEADRDTISGHGGTLVILHRLAGEHWSRLVDTARADGIPEPLLLAVSGYRSVASQQKIWDAALAKYGSEAAARKWVAKPGGSPHHSGRAVDCWLGSAPNSENVAHQRQTAAWQWLVDNAERFGFYAYDAEPWHWEYNPPAR